MNWNGSTYSNGKCDCSFESVLDDCGICDSDPSNDCNIKNNKSTRKMSFKDKIVKMSFNDKIALTGWIAFVTISIISSPSF